MTQGVAREMEGTDGRERRRSKRHSVTDKVFLTVRPHFARLGKIVDISKEGLSFEYVLQDYDTADDAGCAEVDIFAEADDIYVPRIPCKQIYDVKVGRSADLSLINLRRCGLEFGQLSKDQVSQLKSFINACNLGHSLRA